MSLAPLIDPRIRGVEGKRPEMNHVCAVPGCISRSSDGHHMWARSYLRGQPYEWVSLPSGLVVCNVIGLCSRHHNMVTGMVGGHKAMIKLYEGDIFRWLEVENDLWVEKGLLFPQPFREGYRLAADLESQVAVDDPHVDLAPGERCGSCGYKKPVKREVGPKRRQKTWATSVPDDSEDGAQVLDTLVEQVAVYMGLDTESSIRSVRYFAVEAALQFVTMNAPLFIEDLEGGEDA